MSVPQRLAGMPDAELRRLVERAAKDPYASQQVKDRLAQHVGREVGGRAARN